MECLCENTKAPNCWPFVRGLHRWSPKKGPVMRKSVSDVYTVASYCVQNGSLTRYAKLRVAHAPGISEALSPPPILNETASWQSRHESRHVRRARAVMHVGIANPRWRGNVPGIRGACATRNFAYQGKRPMMP